MTRPSPSTESDEAWDALRELRQAPSLMLVGGRWSRPADTLTPEHLEVLMGAAARLGYRAVPALVALSLHPGSGRLAIRLVIRILETAPPMGLLWVERRIRKSGGWATYRIVKQRFRRRSRHEVAAKLDAKAIASACEAAIPIPGWWLLSMSPDGFVREEAVGQLAAAPSSGSLTYLLLRSLDWVLPVRTAAISAFKARVVDLNPAELVELAPLVAHLQGGLLQEEYSYGPLSVVRLDGSVVVAFGAALATPAGQDALLRAVRSGPAVVSRAAFRLLAPTTKAKFELVELALGSRDVVIQRQALRQAQSLASNDQRRALALALGSPFADVRVSALRHLSVTADAESVRAIVDGCLFDRSDSVRGLARFLTKQAGRDSAPLYRAAIFPTSPVVRLCAALLALAELEHDWVTAEDYVRDERPKVRAAAVTAIAHADADAAREILPSLIADEHPAVSNAATRGLAGKAAVAFDDLEKYLTDRRFHVVKNAARLLGNSSPWASLLGALELASSPDSQRLALGIKLLERWSRRTYLPDAPPPADWRPRLEAFAATSAVLSRTVVETFERYSLALPFVSDLLFGSSEAVETLRDRLKHLPVRRFEQRYSSYRGGWHYAAGRPKDPFNEAIYVQKNLDVGELAEQDFPDWPVLVYVLRTRRPDALAQIGDDAGLTLLKRTPASIGTTAGSHSG